MSESAVVLLKHGSSYKVKIMEDLGILDQFTTRLAEMLYIDKFFSDGISCKDFYHALTVATGLNEELGPDSYGRIVEIEYSSLEWEGRHDENI